jgi:hypothetical protein
MRLDSNLIGVGLLCFATLLLALPTVISTDTFLISRFKSTDTCSGTSGYTIMQPVGVCNLMTDNRTPYYQYPLYIYPNFQFWALKYAHKPRKFLHLNSQKNRFCIIMWGEYM